MFIETPASKSSISKRKLIYGVGINDARYITKIEVNGKTVRCPFYQRWLDMIKRCYSDKYHVNRPTYIDCSACDEWLEFSNFRLWMRKQNWKNKCLDKDIIVTGNKIYSPEMCIFVTNSINNILNANSNHKRTLPQGVTFDISRNKYKSHSSIDGKTKNLGRFNTISDASNAYKNFKSNHVLEVAMNQAEPLKGYLIRISHEIKE